MQYKWVVLIFSYSLKFNTALTNITVCHNYNRLLGSHDDGAKIVQAAIGDTINLQCQYCEERNNILMHKIWFYKKRGSSEPPREITSIEFIKIDFDANTLVLKSFNYEDNGIYFCQSTNKNDDGIFKYVLESVFYKEVQFIRGNLQQWKEYKTKYFDRIDNDFEWSEKEPFTSLRKSLHFSFKLLSAWEIWGPCIHNTYLNKAFRYKIGKCLLRPIQCGSTHINEERHSRNMTELLNMTFIFMYFVTDRYDISCSSEQLNAVLPDISRITKSIPDFEIEEHCTVNMAQNKTSNDSKVLKDYFKYYINKTISDNDHYTLICSEATPESEIKWFKDGVLLNNTLKFSKRLSKADELKQKRIIFTNLNWNNMARNEEEPQLTMDSYNSLYILHATKQEEGVYTCLIDGIAKQKWTVFVVSKSKLRNKEFIRYSILLGFVLSLTMTCYCAGMSVAWHRRNSFKNPLNRNLKRNSDSAEQE